MTSPIDQLVASLPPGIDRTLLRVLSFHIGRECAISRPQPRAEIGRLGWKIDDRQMRLTINQLRKDGHLICSAGGENGGYWVASSWQDLNDYINQELHARAMDLLEQEKALRTSAEKLWGSESLQFSLDI